MGVPATGGNRKKVATLVALCRIAERDYHINGIAGWLETPLHSNALITGLGMISVNRYDLVLRLIGNTLRSVAMRCAPDDRVGALT